MREEKISSAQLKGLLLAFTFGSSIIFIPGPAIKAAGNGAWLSILISGAAGFAILACLVPLHRRYPEMSAVQIFRILFGRVIAFCLSFLFIIVLTLMVANITLGLGSFFTTTMMLETPLYIFHFFILLAAACTVNAGVEVMARMFAMFMPLIFGTIVAVLISDLPLYEPGMLLPQFADGFRPILHGAYISYGFPYSEMFLFALLIHFVRKESKAAPGKELVKALAYNIAVFVAVVLCAVMVYGPVAGERKFMLYEMAKVIEIGGVFERVEAIAGIALITGSYMKAAIALKALEVCVTHLFRLKSGRTVLFPMALLIFFVSLTMFPNAAQAETFWSLYWPMITTLGVLCVAAAAVMSFIRFRKPN